MPATLYKPSRRTEIRLRDLLAADVAVWRIAEILEISEDTLRRHYPTAFSDITRARGIKPYIPTDQDRAKVRMLASLGITQVDISTVMGLNHKTVVRYFREELDAGPIEANSKVAAKVFSMAMGPNDGKNTFLAAKWWTAARMGWKESSRNEITGADGGPMRVENQVVVILPDNGRDKVIDVDAEITTDLQAIEDGTNE